MRILQLGKFYPIRGGVEKVMWNITRALSERGVACDMLCARLRGDADDADDENFKYECPLADGFKVSETVANDTILLFPSVRRKTQE